MMSSRSSNSNNLSVGIKSQKFYRKKNQNGHYSDPESSEGDSALESDFEACSAHDQGDKERFASLMSHSEDEEDSQNEHSDNEREDYGSLLEEEETEEDEDEGHSDTQRGKGKSSNDGHSLSYSQSNFDKSREEQSSERMSYLKYYVSCLVLNAAVLSLNSAMAFTSSPSCETEDGRDMTEMFDLAFVGGFVINCCNFLFFAFGNQIIYDSLVMLREKVVFTKMEYLVFTIARIFDTLLFITTLVASILQSILLTNKSTIYCFKQLGVLEMEGHWMALLALS